MYRYQGRQIHIHRASRQIAFGPLIFLTSQENYTLALGITFFKGLYRTQIPYMMAMSFLMVIPMIVVFFFAQKLMIRGVVLSGIKA